jgi:hypothetical protein
MKSSEKERAKSLKRLERVKGIEPSYSAWKSKSDLSRDFTDVHQQSSNTVKQVLSRIPDFTPVHPKVAQITACCARGAP